MIDKNNILQGYKNSVVGIIPEEWDVKTFSELGSTLSTNTLSRDMMNEESGYALNIHYGDVLVKYGEILNCSKINIPWINYEYAENNLGAQLKDGDVVISDTAEDYSVGKVTELQGISNAKVFSGLHTIAYRPNKNIFSQRFLGYYFNSSIYRKQLYPLIQGIKVCSISKSAISKTKLAIPPLAEQKKISEILCTWDDAIEKQSKLIEKLELRKRGLMQRLLTGKTRLPGFTEPWINIRIGELCLMKRGEILVSDDYIFGDIPVVAGGKEPAGFHNVSNRNGNIITISSSGASAGFVAFYEKPIFATDCFTISSSEKYNVRFLYYYLMMSQERIYRLQSGGAQPHVHPKDLAPMMLIIPSLEEQNAVVKIILSSDKEIEIQRKKLEALRQQKRGLMQQLLTGKIRVRI